MSGQSVAGFVGAGVCGQSVGVLSVVHEVRFGRAHCVCRWVALQVFQSSRVEILYTPYIPSMGSDIF